MELVKSRDSRYTDYENLLLRRDALRKDGEQFALSYIRTFGDLMKEVFQKKIECIEKKKKIAYCQARMNRGLEIREHELDSYIESVMAGYYEQLEDMIRENETAKGGTPVSVSEMRKIKEIYRYLAKLIHPDKRPDLADDPYIKESWQQIVLAYTFNDLEDLEELKFKIEMYLENIDSEDHAIEIPDIEEKIAKVTEEIHTILETNPYQYRYILEDAEAAAAKKQELTDELANYTDYSAQLDEVLRQFRIVRYSA